MRQQIMPRSAKSFCYLTIKQEKTTPESDFVFWRLLSLSYGRPSKMLTTASSGFKFQTGRPTLSKRALWNYKQTAPKTSSNDTFLISKAFYQICRKYTYKLASSFAVLHHRTDVI